MSPQDGQSKFQGMNKRKFTQYITINTQNIFDTIDYSNDKLYKIWAFQRSAHHFFSL